MTEFDWVEGGRAVTRAEGRGVSAKRRIAAAVRVGWLSRRASGGGGTGDGGPSGGARGGAGLLRRNRVTVTSSPVHTRAGAGETAG